MNKIYLGKKVYIFEKVSSTMDVSKRLISNQVDEGTVVQEVQSGYTMHDRLLRAAMVGVSKKTTSKKEVSKEEKDEDSAEKDTEETP